MHKEPFNPKPKPDCSICKGTGCVALFTSSFPCECLEPFFGWILPGSQLPKVIYYNIKGEEIEVNMVTTSKTPKNIDLSKHVCVGKLCHYAYSSVDCFNKTKLYNMLVKGLKR